MKSKVINESTRYTLRILRNNPTDIDFEAIKTVKKTCDEVLHGEWASWAKDHHVLVQIIQCDQMVNESGEPGVGTYFSSLQIVVICVPEKKSFLEKNTTLEWHHLLDDLADTVRHELMHFRQDMEGRINGDNVEQEANAVEKGRS